MSTVGTALTKAFGIAAAGGAAFGLLHDAAFALGPTISLAGGNTLLLGMVASTAGVFALRAGKSAPVPGAKKLAVAAAVSGGILGIVGGTVLAANIETPEFQKWEQEQSSIPLPPVPPMFKFGANP